jgi:hypothetical protein
VIERDARDRKKHHQYERDHARIDMKNPGQLVYLVLGARTSFPNCALHSLPCFGLLDSGRLYGQLVVRRLGFRRLVFRRLRCRRSRCRRSLCGRSHDEALSANCEYVSVRFSSVLLRTKFELHLLQVTLIGSGLGERCAGNLNWLSKELVGTFFHRSLDANKVISMRDRCLCFA